MIMYALDFNLLRKKNNSFGGITILVDANRGRRRAAQVIRLRQWCDHKITRINSSDGVHGARRRGQGQRRSAFGTFVFSRSWHEFKHTIYNNLKHTERCVSFYSSSFVFNLHMYSYQCVFVYVCVGVYREGKRYIKLEQILKWIGWIFFFAIFFLFFFLLVPTCVSFLSKSYIVTNVSFFWW